MLQCCADMLDSCTITIIYSILFYCIAALVESAVQLLTWNLIRRPAAGFHIINMMSHCRICFWKTLHWSTALIPGDAGTAVCSCIHFIFPVRVGTAIYNFYGLGSWCHPHPAVLAVQSSFCFMILHIGVSYHIIWMHCLNYEHTAL